MVWAVVAITVASKANTELKKLNSQRKHDEKDAVREAEDQADQARLEAEEDVLEQDQLARDAKSFAKTKGKGLGELGNISLEVDDDDENGLSI